MLFGCGVFTVVVVVLELLSLVMGLMLDAHVVAIINVSVDVSSFQTVSAVNAPATVQL